MEKRSIPTGDGEDASARQDPAAPAREWRDVLRRLAETAWSGSDPTERLLSPADEELLAERLGSLADDSVRTITAYARGAEPGADDQRRARFRQGVSILIAGVESLVRNRAGDQRQNSDRPPIFQSELWLFLHQVRESAELAYSRELNLIELDRRIVFLLRRVGPLVPAGVAGAVGVDKAQVSRSVKRLLELKLIERTQIRSPLRLTPKGEAVAGRLSWLAGVRNRELTFDVGDDELRNFYDSIELLLDRAVLLYEQERDLAQQGQVKGEDRKGSEGIVIDRTRIVSPLLTLSAYFSRSGALAFKRLTGLSNFEAWVLSEISIKPPVSWTELAKTLQRDHSQASRTVTTLIERGLVQRDGKPGRRHGLFYPSAEGTRLNRIIQEEGKRRNAFLLTPLEEDQRARFLATFDKIRHNAVAQLERERALEDLARTPPKEG